MDLVLGYLNQFNTYKYLMYVLARRSIQVRYKQSAFGIAWAIGQPLLLMLVFTLVFSTLLKIPSDGLPYPIFAYSAILPWTLFIGQITQSVPSLEGNAGLVKKIYFPRVLFPVSASLSCIPDFAISALIFLGMMLYFSVPFTLNLLWVIPILLIQVLFTLGLCFILASVNAFYRDVRVAIPLLVQVWMYLCPILYPLSMIPERFKTYYMLNPMAGIMDSWRTVLIKGDSPSLLYLGIAGAGAILMFLVGYWFFKKLEWSFVDVL